MKRFFKKTTSLFLCAVILSLIFPAAYAAEEPDFRAIQSAGEAEGVNSIYVVTPPSYALSYVDLFHGDYAIYEDFYGNRGILDCYGNIVFTPQEDVVPKRVVFDKLFFSNHNFLYDFSGKLLFDRQINYDDCTILKDEATGKALGLWLDDNSVVNQNGAVEEDVSSQAYNGLVIVRKNGKYGVKQLFGAELLPAEYDDLTFMGADTLYFIKNGSMGLMSLDGIVKTTLDYDSVKSNTDMYWHKYYTQYLIVTKDGKSGLVSSDGTEIVPLEYDSIFKYQNDGFQYAGVVNGTTYQISLDDSLRFCGTRNFPYESYILNDRMIVHQNMEDGWNIELLNMDGERLIPDDLSSSYCPRIGDVWAIPVKTGTTLLYDANMQLVAELDGCFNAATADALVFEKIGSDGVKSLEFYGSDGALLNRYADTSINWLCYPNKLIVLQKNGKSAFVDTKGNLITDFIYSVCVEISSGLEEVDYPYFYVNFDGGEHFQIVDGRTGAAVLPEGCYVTKDIIPEGSCFSFYKDGKTGFAKLAKRGEPFIDVPADAWYAKPAAFCFNAGLMSGTGNGCFSPDLNMTRAMLVQVLYAISGEKTDAYGFLDIDADAWYANAVNWAAIHGIVAGTGNGAFSPDASITREQLVAILYKYACTFCDCPADEANLANYSDADQISAYARVPFAWAIANGMVSGTSATTLSPQSTATRAQIATIMRQFIRYMAK